jgi:hypothetical protein
MLTSIFVIAAAFSERKGASWGGAERNAAEQIAAMYSASEGVPETFAAKAAVTVTPTKAPATAAEQRPNHEVKRGMILP